MIRPVHVGTTGGERPLGELDAPLELDPLVPGDGAWEVEVGFGRGSYLVRRAREGERRFLGIELASLYYRILLRRVQHWKLDNMLLLHGEAQYLLSAVLPRRFAAAVHVYFPDPWPKSRHHKRRLFDPESVDLVLDLLADGGRLFFATDHLEYGASVAELLRSHPRVRVEPHEGAWPDGARTNYEQKYLVEGRPILRLVAETVGEGSLLHPSGAAGIVAATSSRAEG